MLQTIAKKLYLIIFKFTLANLHVKSYILVNMSNRSKRENSVAQEKDLHAEISEMKQTLDFVSDKLDVMTRMQSDLDKAMQTITKLQNDNKLKDERIVTLENCLDELEQYSRNDNIVISGLNLQYRSFAGSSFRYL